jgi:hypothetical protein
MLPAESRTCCCQHDILGWYNMSKGEIKDPLHYPDIPAIPDAPKSGNRQANERRNPCCFRKMVLLDGLVGPPHPRAELYSDQLLTG